MAEILAVTHTQQQRNPCLQRVLLELQQLFSLTTFLLLLKSLKPWKAASWLLCNKCRSTGAVRSTQSIPISILQKLLNLKLQRPKPKGRLLPSPPPRPCLLQLLFFSPHFYTHQTDSCSRLREQRMTLLWEYTRLQQHQGMKTLFALCQLSPVILSCCNLNPF